MLGGVAILLLAGAIGYFSGGRYESTDDAYVRVAGVDISSNIAGRVVEIDVKENQQVAAGQVLFRLDPAPYDIAVEQAQAQVADSRLQTQAELASYREKQAALTSAQDAAASRPCSRLRSRSRNAAASWALVSAACFSR